MRLVDRVAVVTGGASGIGLATVGRLVEEGARVVIADLDGDRAAEAAAGFGSAVVGVACDVTRAEDCRAAVETAVERFGQLDLMHANAGTPFTGPLDEVDQATLDRVVDVNLKGAFWTAQAAAPALIEAGGGAIVFTASLQAVIARPRYAPYTAAKHGVIGLMKALALELARTASGSTRSPRRRPRRRCSRRSSAGWVTCRTARGRTSGRRSRWAAWRRRATPPTRWCSSPATRRA